MDAALGAAQAPVADGVLEAWRASKNFGLNVESLRMELLIVKATLEVASGKQLGGPAMEELQKLRDSVDDAKDLLDELDYFRIHDGLHGTYDAADKHAKGGVHNLVLNARHTVKAVGELLCLSAYSSAASPGDRGEEDARQRVSCCAWPCARQMARGNSSSAPDANQADEELSVCMRKLGKLLPRSSSPHVHDDDDSVKSTRLGGVCMHKAPRRKHAEEIPKLRFNRIDFSKRTKHILEQLQPQRTKLTTMLQSCGHNTVPDTSQSRTITTGRSIEPKLYGRDRMVNSIIHDITNGKYCGEDLSVLPIVGPGGIGKTTMVQHIYQNQEVQNHFQVRIWVCVSLNFNLNKLLEEIKEGIPEVKGEEKGKPEELIAQRLKSKRFLLVLDDIWGCSNEDDWKRLLLPLNRSQEKGSVILVTTRFKKIAQMVKTTEHSIELEGLVSTEFRDLFYAFVFGDEQCRRDYTFLLDTGDKIMEKLKGSPLAAKTLGRLLRQNLSLPHWKRVLENKEWDMSIGDNDIMPALKLSYDYLPFDLQQCFSYSALFPEHYHFRSSELINLWVGLDILQPGAQNQTYEEIGLSKLKELVTHGFFKEGETDGRPCYVMHDLLYDLALKVAFHGCLSLHRFNVGSVEIPQRIRHLSIVIDDVGDDNVVSGENFKSELRKLKTKLKVEHLQTLMLFGGIDESLANIFGDLFREATALRVLHLPKVSYSVESILHKFYALVHLRYLYLGTEYESQMHLPLNISRFYHLRILDLGSWYGSCDFPKDMSLVFLQTLDLRSTSVKELPESIAGAIRLKCLRVNSRTRIPHGIRRMEDLEVLEDINISNPELLKELCSLTKLMVLGIAIWSWDDSYDYDALLDYLGSLAVNGQNIKSISILTCCSLDFLDQLDEKWFPPSLTKLEIRGSTFLTLPERWVSSLRNISSLYIEVQELSQQIIHMLGMMPSLCSLSLTSKRVPEPEGRFGKYTEEFRNLTGFHLVSNAMGKMFEPGALPMLERLKLSFEASRTEDVSPEFDFGLENLPSSLKHLRVEINCFNASLGLIKKAEDAIWEQIYRGRSGLPNLEIQRVREEDKVEEAEDVRERVRRKWSS